jgi:uncharacterized RDD family membrane protein YckC
MNTNRTEAVNAMPAALADPALYDGVRTRRVLAFLIDYVLVVLMLVPATILVAILGLATLGAGWILYGILVPMVALAYVWFTLGGPEQATAGMRMMGIRLERIDGAPVGGMLAVFHSVAFWALTMVISPLILLSTLFLDYKSTVHDLLLGTVVVRAERRAR